MTEQYAVDATREFDSEGNIRELHRALLSTQGVEEFLHELAVLAARLVGGGLSCGMTMPPDGKTPTVACSDPLAARVDEVQYELDDGPCLHAVRDGRTVRIEDTAEKARWPEFEALNADGKPVGALTLYARAAAAFGPAEARRAENFAENASGALSLAIKLSSRTALIEQLRSSLASRGVIDQALGIIMAREQCTQDRAFAIMRAASQNSNVKLRDIASAVVTSITGEPPRSAPPFEDGQP
jgi:hypothetical protein